MKKYYYTDGVDKFGPFTLEELAEKKISRKTQVWHENLSDWQPAESVFELKGILHTSPPPLRNTNAKKNRYGTNQIQDLDLISDRSRGDVIILIVVIWMIVTRFFWTITTKFFDNFYSELWFKPIESLMSLVWALIPIGLAFTVKDKSKQTILFILGGIYFIFGLYEAAVRFMQ